MRKLLIVGNWKMHLNPHEASILAQRLTDNIKIHRNIDVVLAPNMMVLQPIARQIDKRRFKIAAQNAYFKDEGAFTGEISFTMLRGIAEYCLIGHSERRIYFHETLEEIRDKMAASVRNGIIPVLCVGENSSERESGETHRVIHDQVVTALSDLTASEVEDIIIAYEPVWAISTFGGTLAKPSEVKPVIDEIRSQVAQLYGKKVAERLRVIYGGSVDDQLASGYLEIEGVDGLLPGSASLNYKKFSGIIAAAEKLILSGKK